MDGRDPEKMQLRAALEASESALRELRNLRRCEIVCRKIM